MIPWRKAKAFMDETANRILVIQLGGLAEFVQALAAVRVLPAHLDLRAGRVGRVEALVESRSLDRRSEELDPLLVQRVDEPAGDGEMRAEHAVRVPIHTR